MASTETRDRFSWSHSAARRLADWRSVATAVVMPVSSLGRARHEVDLSRS
jgi:hypothetical protein